MADPCDVIARYFALDAFRPGQREAIDAALGGRDALVVLPTGGGKSLIYQVAALALPGTAIVVSPLIALMRDQVERLRERGVPGVAALHSQVPVGERSAALAALGEGRLRLLYVTPERCAQEEFLAAARRARISLLAVDEAHCISEWGHDFRPSYQLLDDAARALGRPPILALTATATPWVREQIVERLELRDPCVIVRGFDRPNLFYEVYVVQDENEKRRRMGELLAEGGADYPEPVAGRLGRASAGGGIVYTALTRTARDLSQWLNRRGVHSAYYHGRLRAAARSAVHQRFSEGTVRAIAATNAFGLGIDRADLRFVLHYDAPSSVEAYYQESGRAGRDGEPARCTLLFSDDDLGRLSFTAGSGAVAPADLERIAEAVGRAPAAGITRAAVAGTTGLGPGRAIRGLELLVACRALAERRGRYRARDLRPELLAAALERDERRRNHDRTRLEMVRAYARAEGCRRQFLLHFFGQFDAPDRCDWCDRCVPRPGGAVVATSSPAAGTFRPGDEVTHASWGRGTVQHIAEGRVTVHFNSAGYRTLDLNAVEERGLMTSNRRA